MFDLTSNQQASQNYQHPEATNAEIAISFPFSTTLVNNREVFLLGEKASTTYINSVEEFRKKIFLNTKIDSQ